MIKVRRIPQGPYSSQQKSVVVVMDSYFKQPSDERLILIFTIGHFAAIAKKLRWP